MKFKLLHITVFSSAFFTSMVSAQNSAPSSHFNLGEASVDDIRMIDVRVPKKGLAKPTYYETLSMLGNKGNSTGNGYAGIQESPDRRGNRVHIFSIWHSIDDPTDKEAYPYVVHLGHGMKSDYFGGEGVGLKTWKYTGDESDPLYWDTDVWHTHVIRCWDVGEHTHYGFFVRDGSDGIWRHLSTIAVREGNLKMTGRNDSFLEDWLSTGEKHRVMHLRHCWKRTSNKEWVLAQKGQFSVNHWDLGEKGRSFNFKSNWNAGVSEDKTGGYYFLEIGGDAKPVKPLAFPAKTSAEYSLKTAKQVKPDHAPISVIKANAMLVDGQVLRVSWMNDEKTLPQFSYDLKIYQKGENKPIRHLQSNEPTLRSLDVDLNDVKIEGDSHYLTLTLTDILDNTSKVYKAPIKR